MSSPKSYVTEFGDRVFREVKFNGHKDEAHVLSGWCPYKSRHQSPVHSLSTSTQRKSVWRCREKVTVHKLEREASQGTESAATSI